VRIAVLGTGTVGRTLADGLRGRGHRVTVGTRNPERADVAAWSAESGLPVRPFESVAEEAALVVNATAGAASLAVLERVGGHVDGRVLLDVANPLDTSHGFPPSLIPQPGGTSLAEQIQAAHPRSAVVKALNTVNASVMTEPGALPGLHHLPVCGDDEDAKDVVVGLLAELGWRRDQVLDLGGLVAARGMEAYLLFWVSVLGAVATPRFNVRIVR
jgi:8-hydroxy-5-deazaflavin:NADPH oxidoreductase